jgi:hypothetical protein
MHSSKLEPLIIALSHDGIQMYQNLTILFNILLQKFSIQENKARVVTI